MDSQTGWLPSETAADPADPTIIWFGWYLSVPRQVVNVQTVPPSFLGIDG
jgi:hypothetical protein